jgi:predicted glycoside hydrolase/deacetylase ChbG (UPF0249 family)
MRHILLNKLSWCCVFTALLVMGFISCYPAIADDDIKLIIRADDIGAAHSVNLACIQSYKDGIARSVEVLVTAPWFNEAAEMLNDNPGYDVGVHLDLTSEWEYYKWGPISNAPSLVDDQGHFFPMTSQRKDFPPNTAFLQSKWKIEEVEQELRAQIELAKKKIPHVSHMTSHMGTATCTPELKALVNRLSKEYKLPLSAPGLQNTGGFGGSQTTPDQKVAAMVKILENLKPGVWLFVDHPALDTPEMETIGHKGYRNVAADRDGVTKAFTSDKVKEVIKRRVIKLVGYKDLF